VLDEGVDVPDAELGIIVSGTGSSREFIQRLGRLLRPKPDSSRRAKLIEIVSSGTREMGTSAKRKRAFDKVDKEE
jgi:superfamily II DNA or RNA helicase